ncbi:MAG: GNAT family N-acetyltransferase [Candidatus Competibacteraceae bacterium]|nr:GNAT family N-acetyltransferase [Candidatus Competibacteraceae bacterium]
MSTFDSKTGYVPGVIGRTVELHALYYSENWNFGHLFETKVASEMSDFINNYNPKKDCIWSVSVNGKIEGSLSIDGSSEKENIAHFRWFILSDALRGQGVGNFLMEQAVSFCENTAYDMVYLWTFKGLKSARYLYEKHGFEIKKETDGMQWGTKVTEQYFELQLKNKKT